MRRFVQVLVAVAVLAVPVAVGAAGHVEEVTTFDPFAAAEGIAVDRQGNVFVSLQNFGQVWKIAPDGTESLLWQFDYPGTGGLAVDRQGHVYAAHGIFVSPGQEDTGVWKIWKDGSKAKRLPGTENIVFPNALAFDKRGNLYVTETVTLEGLTGGTIEGSIWRIPKRGTAELWYRDAGFLGGTDILADAGFPPIGANGISYYKKALYVANTNRFHIVKIPIVGGDQPGTPEIVADVSDGLVFPDGTAFDATGHLWVVAPATHPVDWATGVLYRVNVKNGDVDVVATAADGLRNPTSLAFGRKGDKRSIFVTAWALLYADQVADPPGVHKVDVGVKGLPLP